MRPLPAFICLLTPFLAAAPPKIRVGLDTQALEWTVGLEGGGELRDLEGRRLLELPAGEKLRIWWDSRGEADPTDEYRVQVGGPMPAKAAEALMARIRELGEHPDKVAVPDGGTWRARWSVSRARKNPHGTLQKDVLEVQDMAAAQGVQLSVIEDVLRDYARLIDAGFGDEDISAIYRLTRALFPAKPQP